MAHNFSNSSKKVSEFPGIFFAFRTIIGYDERNYSFTHNPMTTVEKESNELVLSPERVSKSRESSKNLAVFSEGKSEITDSLEKTTDPIRTELETLRELQKMSPTLEREQQIFDLERKRKRSMSFAFLQAK